MQPPLRRESETGRPGLAFQFGPCSSGAARPASPLLSRQRPLPAHAYPPSSRWHGYSCPCAPRWWPASPQMAHCALFLPVRAPLVVEARKDTTALGIPARARPAVPRSCPCPPRPTISHRPQRTPNPSQFPRRQRTSQSRHHDPISEIKPIRRIKVQTTPYPPNRVRMSAQGLSVFLFRHSGFLFRHSGESRNPTPYANMTLQVPAFAGTT